MHESFSEALDATWARSLETQGRRVAAQETAIVAALAGTLDAQAREHAQREAHKLAGSLGSFGLQKASELAAELEQAWTASTGTTPDATQLAQVVANLRKELQSHHHSSQQPPECTLPIPGEHARPVDVLLVDDDQVFAEFAMSVLRWSKRQVTWIADGQSARAALCGAEANLRPRLILLDIEMPGLDGFGLLEDISHSDVSRQSAVVMLTRHTMAEDIIRAHKLGAVDYLAKPLPAATLIQRVNRALAA